MKQSERQLQLAAALEKIRRANKGRLTCDLVIAAARSKTSVLHDEFEWDVQKAAAAHWRATAQRLITYVMLPPIVHKSERVLTPMYVRDPTAAANEQGHVSIEDVAFDQARAIVEGEIDRVKASVERARGFALYLDNRFPGLADDLDSLLAKAAGLQAMMTA